MKITKLVAVAALGLFASTAFAQGNGSDVTGGTVSATVGGVFVPTSTTTVSSAGGTITVTAPPTTPVTIPQSVEAASVPAALTSGAPAAVAQFTQSLTTSGMSGGAAQGIANALQSLGANPTVASVQAALTSWNNTLQSMSAADVTALVGSPQGMAAVAKMVDAFMGLQGVR
jgi:hypothetical protein